MNAKMAIEIFGYIGSALVVISMLMSSIVKLRVINMAGSVISCIYAIICHAMPLAVMNICLIIINAISLYKLLRTKQEYELVEGASGESFVGYFLDRYGQDIKTFFPGFDRSQAAGKKAFVVCCNGTPAGLLLGDAQGDLLDVLVDYSTPAYRDCSVGNYLYPTLAGKNIHTLRFAGRVSEGHRPYLNKMGFELKDGVYIRKTA